MRKFTPLVSGEYAGKTAPWLAFHKPDVLFRGLNQGLWQGTPFGTDAEIISELSKVIKSPPGVATSYSESGVQFSKFLLILNYDGIEATDTFDMYKAYTKYARVVDGWYRSVKEFKIAQFGSSSYRMTLARCEEFFLNPDNFHLDRLPEEYRARLLTEVAETTPTPTDASETQDETISPPKVEAPPSKKTSYKKKDTGITIDLYVPSGILDIIDREFPQKTENRWARTIIFYILHRHQLYGDPIISFIAYPKKLKDKITTSNYYFLWRLLEGYGILKVYTTSEGYQYSTKLGIAKRYRISPDMIRPPFIEVAFKANRRWYTIDSGKVTQHTANSIQLIKSEKPDPVTFEKQVSAINKKIKLAVTLQYMSDESISRANPTLDQNQIQFSQYQVGNLKEFDILNSVSGMITSLRLLDENFIYVTRADTNSRVSQNLTNSRKILFPFLKMGGQSIIEFDLSNSQPLLLAHILNNILSGSSSNNVIDIFLYEYTLNAPHPSRSPQPPLLCSHFDQTKLELLRIESEDFFLWCRSGVFYSRLMDYLNDIDRHSTKSEVKQGFIKTIFGKYNQSNKLKRKIAMRFPIIIELLEGFKKTMYLYFDDLVKSDSVPPELKHYYYSKKQGSKSPFDAGNDYIAIRLQELEAFIFVDTILGTLADKNIPSFTRHDSVCCQLSRKAEVHKVVVRCMSSMLGENGYHLKVEEWTKQPD